MARQMLKNLFSERTISRIKKEIPDISMLKLFSFGNALIRPCGASIRDEVSKGNFHRTGIEDLDDLLKQELFVCIIQEDIMRFVMQFCGYDLAQADYVRKCIAKDSSILMADGSTKMIQDIIVGDRVQSYNNGYYSGQNVTNVFYNGKKEVYKICTKNGFELKSTKDHKYLTQRGWVELQDITEDDYLFVPEKINADKSDIDSNKRISTSDMFLIGMLIGDGSIGNTSDIHFTNSDNSLIDKFKLCVNNRIKNRIEPCDFYTFSAKGIDVQNVYSVYIKTPKYRKSVINLIKKYELNKKAAEKFIPKELMGYPVDEKLLNLLGGLFSTDGGYNNGNCCIEYYTISKRLAIDVQCLLIKLGIFSSISKKIVKKYNYYSYVVMIRGPKYLKIFEDTILQYVVGKKYSDFKNITNIKSNSKQSFNYILPSECKKEILEQKNNSGLSCKDIRGYCFKFDICSDTITDVLAEEFIKNLYCPITYGYLCKSYVPVKVKDIKYIGIEDVYDIEVENTHNFVANGITVHNCIAKKRGTEQLLKDIKTAFIETSKPKYNLSDEKCEEVINPILKYLEDASRYAFSWNHSDAYSYIGYACGYLRYYYPVEFITACLNIWQDNQEKTSEIKKYANAKNIKINEAKFRNSRSDYFFDKENKCIYKGMKSIKFLNKKSSDELYEFRNRDYQSFIDVLYDIKDTSINSRQVDVLIKLDFFSEFGNSKELLETYKVFQEFKNGEAKSINKAKLENDPIKEEIIKRFSQETKSTYKILNCKDLLEECERYIKSLDIPDLSLALKAQIQNEYLGYVNLSLNTSDIEVRRQLFILSIKPLVSKRGKNIGKPWAYAITAQSIGSGITSEYLVLSYIYSNNPILENNLIYVRSLKTETYNGRKNWYITSYDILQ